MLSENRGIQTILTGGFYLQEEKSFYGHLDIEMIRQFHVAKYFITPSAISLNFGINNHIHELIGIQQAMMGITDEIYVLVDSSKFETCAPAYGLKNSKSSGKSRFPSIDFYSLS